MKVRIDPYIVKVKYDTEAMTAASANGVWMEDLATILLQTGNDKNVERETLLHECLHALWSQTLLDKQYPDEAADSPGEEIIAVLAPRLLALLRSNPKLVRFLTEDSDAT